MTAKSISSVLLIFLFMIMLPKLPIRLMAQDSATGAIRGTVLDATGGRIAQASVVVVNTATGARYTTTSDGEGAVCPRIAAPRRLLGARGS